MQHPKEGAPLPSTISRRGRKKKVQPGREIGGSVTRSRSEAFLRRTRSGLILKRTFSSSSDETPNTTNPPPPTTTIPSADTGGPPIIKDLRARRVFSSAPTSISTCCHHLHNYHHLHISGSTFSEEEEHDRKPPSSSIDDGICLKQDESKEKGCDVTTPPEDSVAVASSVEMSPPPLSPSSDHPIGHDNPPPPPPPSSSPPPPPPPLQQLPSAATDDEDKGGSARGGDLTHKTLALAPCSRLKVFPNPTSHCYRRLLPFLVDITKHNSGELEIVSTKSGVKRTEHDTATKKPSPLLVSPLLSNEEDDTKRRSQKEEASIQDAITKKETVCVNEPNEMSLAKRSSDVPICEFELLCKLEQSQPPIPREDLTFEELAGVDVDAKHRNGKKESVVDPGSLTSSCTSVKSILKRKREGCKGPCPCLDCASFRLHAERAFEFSRKQMHDMENVTTILMKELGGLRKLVADSIVPLVGKEGYGILQLNQVQVKDICRKALETEKGARNKLREMATDLNAHCRITRRLQHKVTFADHGKDEDLK